MLTSPVTRINNSSFIALSALLTLACTSSSGGSSNPSDPILAFGSIETSVFESAGTASITLTLDKAASKEISLPYTLGGAAVEGTDFEVTSANPLVIAEGEAQGTIEFTINDDSEFNGGRPVVITLDPPSGANLGTDIVHTLRIRDDEYLLSFAADETAVADGSGVLELSVLFSGPQSEDIEIPLTIGGTAVEGVDYIAPTLPVVMPAGDEFVILEFDILESTALNTGLRSIVVDLGTPDGGVLGPSPTHSIQIEYSPYEEVEPNNLPNDANNLIGPIGELVETTEFQITGSVEAGAPNDPYDIFAFELAEGTTGTFTVTPLNTATQMWMLIGRKSGLELQSAPGEVGEPLTIEVDFTEYDDLEGRFLVVVLCLNLQTEYTIDVSGGAASSPSSMPGGSGPGDSMSAHYQDWLHHIGLDELGVQYLHAERVRMFGAEGRLLGDFETRVERR